MNYKFPAIFTNLHNATATLQAASPGITGHRYSACCLPQFPIYDSTISNYIIIDKTTIQTLSFSLMPVAAELLRKWGIGGGEEVGLTTDSKWEAKTLFLSNSI